MKTRFVAVIALAMLILSVTLLFINLNVNDEPANPDESLGTTFISADNPLNKNFTIIVLPDTQGYTTDYPWLFDTQTQWIVDSKEEMNIVFVTQLGDLVENADNSTQWEIANRCMSTLTENVAWSVLLGNHDMANGESTNYNKYFGYSRFCDKSWYGGAYTVGDNANSYQLFSAGGDDYLIFHLQYNPSDDVLFWASNVIDKYPDRRVIVSTHDYIMGPMNCDRRSDIGERIWHSFIKEHSDQIFLVLCAHASTQSRISDTVDGHVVYQLLADYQNSSNIENGWLRILTFCPSLDKIEVKTYSPYLNKYKTDPENQFILDYEMAGGIVSVFSDFTVSQLAFDETSNQIRFEVSGKKGSTGYCNVTIPKALLTADPWTLKIDNNNWKYTITQNATHTAIYFTYTYSDPVPIVIE